MRNRKPSFYFFITTILLLASFIVWWFVANSRTSALNEQSSKSDILEDASAHEVTASQVPALEESPATAERKAVKSTQTPVQERNQDLFDESLRQGYFPTQDIGEMGSLMGILDTNYPMVYADSKYERIEGTPLIRFTDDMIWREGETFVVKRDAMSDQARHIQETSIALSVAPRIEFGETTGYRVVEIPDGTLFSQLGILPGDVILTVNDSKPDTEQMALMFVNMVAGKQGKTKLTIESRGKKRTLDIRASE